MKATLLRIEQRPSKYNSSLFYYFFFKGEDGKSYRSCIDPACGNFRRWSRFIGCNLPIVLGNLRVLKSNIIDADCEPEVVK